MSFLLLTQTKLKARKDHRCIWCGQLIPKGENYIRESSIFENDFQDHKWHPECHEVAVAKVEGEFDAGCNERPKNTPQ